MDKNPYKTPGANLEGSPSSGSLHDPRGVSIGQGITWFTEGFRLFSAYPLMWIVTMVILFILVIVMSVIPIVNVLVYLIMPVFVAGLMMGCQAQDNGKEFEIGHLFAAFSSPVKLLGIGAVYIAGNIIAIAISFMVLSLFGDIGAMFSVFVGQEPDFGSMQAEEILLLVSLMLLIYVGLVIPVMMATWFAPALIALHNLSIGESLSKSFRACLKNILPFLLYGIVLLIVIIIGAIPLGLGLLVVIPAMYASVYASYKDVFIN